MSLTKQCTRKNTSLSNLIQNKKMHHKRTLLFKALSRIKEKKEKRKVNWFLPMHSGGLKLILFRMTLTFILACSNVFIYLLATFIRDFFSPYFVNLKLVPDD